MVSSQVQSRRMFLSVASLKQPHLLKASRDMSPMRGRFNLGLSEKNLREAA